ncbi:ABC transporter permease [Paenibacillus baekrokdamisoli]|uniref:ABC transporter permease n=1 Tax=Paenibacillus baekrokdamisoli TaxID=1712516 RepID=A0A3G9J8P2_9BACL|nr:sugar ABC transporter permease [Paenibacillus baekrokdamisoli]MBB3067405.1 raffinose/stachyose/melibiose transport system permease protein [Paenibacillus baekrokdamisoli]BBH19409.1 ABC transporter permease [Paenibacillus baekrokdamisoli]
MTNKKGKLDFLLFVSPAIIAITVAIYIPFIMSSLYSLTDWNGIAGSPKFIGLHNFISIFKGDLDFKNSSIFTVKYSVLYILLVNLFSLAIAIILDKNLKFSKSLRVVFFIPYVFSLIVVGFIWKFIFSGGFQSLHNFTQLEVFEWSWLGEPNLAFISIVIVSIWQSIGFYIVLYIAGLQGVPKDLLEASTIDGASYTQSLFRVTLPLLAPAITTCTFYALINSIKVFDVILSLTQGGPGGSTYSVTMDIYREAFQNNNYGYGTAKSIILFLAILIITVVQLKFFKSREIES